MSNPSRTLLLAPIAAAAILASTTANAQSICGPRPGIIEVLKSKFSEEQNGVGIVNQATVFELYVSAEGSWTMLATNTAGISCIVGSGTNWQGVVVADRNARAS